ncbi:MAG: DUF945 family protein [Sulfurospirillaceae bacterium]|nr:DUF945 family protein [Sulfurospirillaceae bacterium]
MNKKIIFFILIIVVGILAFPAYENHIVEQRIAQEKTMLNAKGIELSIDMKQGYFVSIRKFDLTFKDGQAIANAMKKSLIDVYPLYQDSIEKYFKKEQANIVKNLEGTKFSGFITVDNLMLNKPNLRLVLKELSTDLMQNIKKDPSISSVVLPWLEHGLIAFKVIFNKDGSIERIAMRNFDEKFTSGAKKRENHIKIIGNQLIVLDKNSGEYRLKEEYITSKKASSNTDAIMMQLKDLNYKYKYDDMLNQTSSMRLKNFVFKIDDRLFMNLSLENFDVDSNIASTKDKTNFMANYKIDNINYTTSRQPFKLGNLDFKIAFDDLDTQALKTFAKSYRILMLSKLKHDRASFNSDLQKVANKGFNLEVDGALTDMAYSMFTFKSINVKTNIKVAPNDLGRHSKPSEIDKFVSMTADITLKQHDMDQFAIINPRLVNRFKKYAEKKGDDLTFHVVSENSKVTINGKKL